MVSRATARLDQGSPTLTQTVRNSIDLRLGDPCLPTPEPAVEAAYQAVRHGDVRYTPAAGTPELRAAVAEKFRRDGIACAPERVVVGSGAKSVLFALLAGDQLEGREVIIPAPHYAAYPGVVRLAGGTPRVVHTDEADGFKITPEQLRSHLSPATRWLFLNSPANPTGATYSRDEIAALGAELLRFPNVMVLSDEIYELFCYSAPMVPVATVSDDLARRTVTLNGVSKTYSMTGWRIGYATGPQDVIDRAIAVQFSVFTCPPSVSQAAALAALTMDQDPIRARNAVLVEHRDAAVAILRQSRLLSVPVPAGSFYIFPAVRRPSGSALHGMTDAQLVAYLADQAGVLVTPGTSFGAPGHFRMSFAPDRSTVAEACTRVVAALDKLEQEGPQP
jgi:aspartate aminotransferase